MPSDTTRTATDAVPAVKVGDKVKHGTLPLRGVVSSVKPGSIGVFWRKQEGPSYYTPDNFAQFCELRPSRRALRDQLQKAEAERDMWRDTCTEHQHSWSRQQEQLQQARDAHALTKAALLDEERAHLRTAEARNTAQQELQQARGLMEGMASQLRLWNTNCTCRTDDRTNATLREVDAYLAGTKDTAAEGGEG